MCPYFRVTPVLVRAALDGFAFDKPREEVREIESSEEKESARYYRGTSAVRGRCTPPHMTIAGP